MSAQLYTWLNQSPALDAVHPSIIAALVVAAILTGLLTYRITLWIETVRAQRRRAAEEEQQVATFQEALLLSQAPICDLARASGLPRELLLLRRKLASGAA